VDTTILWADTGEPGDMVIPVGGTTGQALVKVSGSDYDTDWATLSDDIPKSIIDAKGDLIIGTAADTASRLAVGTANGQVLTVDSTTAEGVKWARKGVDGASAIANSVNYWGVPGVITTAANSSVSLSGLGNNAIYFPVMVYDEITVTDAQISVISVAASAGGLARLSCYTSDANWQPVSLVEDWGEVQTDSVGDKTISSLSTKLITGRYLLRAHFNSTATMPTMIFVTCAPLGGIATTLSGLSTVVYWRRNIGSYGVAETNPSPWNASSSITTSNFTLDKAQRSFIQLRWTS
jgi:hypothetical protein